MADSSVGGRTVTEREGPVVTLQLHGWGEEPDRDARLLSQRGAGEALFSSCPDVSTVGVSHCVSGALTPHSDCAGRS